MHWERMTFYLFFLSICLPKFCSFVHDLIFYQLSVSLPSLSTYIYIYCLNCIDHLSILTFSFYLIHTHTHTYVYARVLQISLLSWNLSFQLKLMDKPLASPTKHFPYTLPRPLAPFPISGEIEQKKVSKPAFSLVNNTICTSRRASKIDRIPRIHG